MATDIAVDGETQKVVDWLTDNVGGKVVSIARQPRWRPQWIADVERDGETLPLMVRGERYDMELTWSLEHEMNFQKTMGDIGVAVPHVWVGSTTRPRSSWTGYPANPTSRTPPTSIVIVWSTSISSSSPSCIRTT